MKALIKIFFVLGVCFGISSCYFGNHSIYVRNSSNDTVYWQMTISARDSIEFSELEVPALYKLPPCTTEYIGYDTFAFEDDCNGPCRICYISFFFFKKDTVEKYGEEYIKTNNIYDKRWVVDMNDLKKMNYIIVYPYDRKMDIQ